MAQPASTPSLSFLRLRPSRLPLRASWLGLLLGFAGACVVDIGHWGDADECYEAYEDCVENAFVFNADTDACEALLDSCLEDCEAGETGAGDDSGSSSTGDDSGSSSTDGDGDGDSSGDSDDSGDSDSGDSGSDSGDGDGDSSSTGDGDGDGIDPACFDLHANCVAEAMTLQDIEACEALFDNCIDPGPCDDPECEPGCPQADLDACVEDYAGCAEAADSAEEILACEAGFDACIADFDVSLCLPNYDDDLVLACLDQHGLCIACAHTPEEIAACMATFDNCLEA